MSPEAGAWSARAESWVRSHGEVLLLMLVALASALAYFRSAGIVGLPFDDSYISLQFARNLADHGYFTFDGDEASAGATSPLHVVLLALPIKFGAAPIWTSIVLGIVTHLALVASVYWLAWSTFRDRWTSTIAGLSVAVIGYLVLDALNGMETTLFLVVTSAATAALFSARTWRGYLLAGLLMGGAVLTRPEAVLLLGAMGVYYVAFIADARLRVTGEDLRRLAMLAGPAAVALGGLAVFYWATTGTLTPGAATAKLLFFREFELGHVLRFDMAEGGVANFIGPVLPWLGLSAFAIRRREAALFAVFWAAFVIFYYFLLPGGLGHYWYRYQHVFLPPLAVFGSAGLVSLVREGSWQPAKLILGASLGIVLVGMVCLQYLDFRDHYIYEVELSEGRQVEMALYLRDEVPPGVSIATHDIGAIAYLSEHPVIDLVGLVNPDVVEYHDGRRLREYVDQVRPGYLVLLDEWERIFIRIGVEGEPELFEEVRVFPGGRSGPFTVYRTHYPP